MLQLPFSCSSSLLPTLSLHRYSGTSADLLKTVLDLVISVRVFLGRFDMRTLEVGVACGGPWWGGVEDHSRQKDHSRRADLRMVSAWAGRGQERMHAGKE